MTHIDYDVIVAGGGVAGITAAAALKEFGWSVLIVEPGQHSGRRLAGELIHPPGVAALIDLGLFRGNCFNGSVPIRGFIAFPGAEDDRSDIPLPYVEGQSCDRGLALDHSRIRTDLQTAVKGMPYVKTLCGRVVGIENIESRTSVTVKASGKILNLSCHLIISADGASSPVRSLAGITHTRRPISTITGYAITARNLPAPGFGHVFMGSLAPLLVYEIGGGRARVLFDQPMAQSDIEPAQHRARVAATIPYPLLRAEIAAAMEAERGLSFVSADLIVGHATRGRVALVGDASGSCHPLTATGMTIGAADALRLRDALRESRGDIPTGLAIYGNRRRAPQRARLLVASALHEACSGGSLETRHIRRGLIRYWTRGERGRLASMAILAMSDDRLWSVFREMLIVILHGFAPPWKRRQVAGFTAGVRLMAGLADFVRRQMTFAMRAR
jgi:2-polyprenyl-6-methoxyphenol hydroxylase-like FAD-dependent oxidoreductase